MYTYKVTVLFQPEWPAIFTAIFGDAAQCSASLVDAYVATYSFDSPQTPADLGPLVRVELLPNE
jgi:hypothetical protein